MTWADAYANTSIFLALGFSGCYSAAWSVKKQQSFPNKWKIILRDLPWDNQYHLKAFLMLEWAWLFQCLPLVSLNMIQIPLKVVKLPINADLMPVRVLLSSRSFFFSNDLLDFTISSKMWCSILNKNCSDLLWNDDSLCSFCVFLS